MNLPKQKRILYPRLHRIQDSADNAQDDDNKDVSAPEEKYGTDELDSLIRSGKA